MTVGVVTGAASGMGRACVDRMRDLVDHVVAVDIKDPEIPGTTAVTGDISDPAAISGSGRRVAELGPFRALAHAAGLSPTMADPRRIVEVNVVGTVRLLDAFEALVEPGSAAVCFVLLRGLPPTGAPRAGADRSDQSAGVDDFLDRTAALLTDSGLAYAWAKKGVQLEAAKAAVRWGRRGGRVVSLSPGLIDTPMGRQEFENQPLIQQLLDHTPLGRFGTAHEVAAVVAFLLSADVAFVSGIDVLVDGALSAANAAAVRNSRSADGQAEEAEPSCPPSPTG